MNQKLSLSGRYLDDTELSLKAKGLFALMLDIRDKCTTAGPWYCTIQKLAGRNRDGTGSVSKALRELEDAGYVERQRIYNDEGRLNGMQYILHRNPLEDYPAMDDTEVEK